MSTVASSYLLDSDALIDYLRGVPLTLNLLSSLLAEGALLCVCDVVLAEVMSGIDERDRLQVEEILGGFPYLVATRHAAFKAGEWRHGFARSGRQIQTPDSLIGAIAWWHGATLITGNLKDFPMSELRVLALPRTP